MMLMFVRRQPTEHLERSSWYVTSRSASERHLEVGRSLQASQMRMGVSETRGLVVGEPRISTELLDVLNVSVGIP